MKTLSTVMVLLLGFIFLYQKELFDSYHHVPTEESVVLFRILHYRQ